MSLSSETPLSKFSEEFRRFKNSSVSVEELGQILKVRKEKSLSFRMLLSECKDGYHFYLKKYYGTFQTVVKVLDFYILM
jgi:hypothetical protein